MAHHHTEENGEDDDTEVKVRDVMDDDHTLPGVRCDVCGDALAGNREYLRHKYAHAKRGESPDGSADGDGPDWAKFASGFLLIMGMFACMTLVAAPLGIPMVLAGYWIYKKHDVSFDVAT